MKHMKAEAWTYHEMTPERTAAWFKQQSDDQIRVLAAHNVWYGPDHLRPRRDCPPPASKPLPEPDIKQDIEPDTPESMTAPPIVITWHPERGAPRIRVTDIAAACARYAGVGAEELKSARRPRSIVRPRQAAMYLATMHTTRSLPEIGRALGGKDHSTVMHGRDRVKHDLATGGEVFGALVAHVELELGLR